MKPPIQFHTQTALAHGLRTLFQRLEERLELNKPLNVYLPMQWWVM